MGLLDSITGLFGVGKNDYGAKQDRQRRDQNYANESGIAGEYGRDAVDQSQQYGVDNSAYRGDLTNLRNYLSNDPNTAQARDRYLSPVYDQINTDLQQGTGDSIANAAMRGVSGSSISAGQQAYLSARANAARASAQQQYQQQALANQGRRLDALTSLDQGVADTEYGRRQADLGAQVPIYSHLAGAYGQDASQEEQQQRGDVADFWNGLGTIGSAFAGPAGMAAAAARPPTSSSTPAYGAPEPPVGQFGSNQVSYGGGYGGGNINNLLNVPKFGSSRGY
jgi:hypothetical protein